MSPRVRPLVPLSELIFRTLSLCLSSWQTVLVSTLTFALLAATLSTFPERAMQQREDALAQSIGITWDQLRTRVEADVEALLRQSPESILKQMESLPLWPSADASPHISLVYFLNVGPYALASLGIVLLVLFVSLSYFFYLFSSPGELPWDAVRHLPAHTSKHLSLFVAVMIASLFWVPFVGPFLMVYMIPRLSLSPALLSRERCGFLAALRESWRLSRRHWFGLLLRLLILFLFAVPLLWALSIPASIAALFVPKLASLFGIIALALLTAYIAAGMTVLAR